MRNRKFNMDAANSAKILNLPGYKTQGIPDESSTEEKRGWFFRRMVDIGAIEDMANPQPKGWNINPSNITVLIAILVFIGGLYTWTYNEAYKRGQSDTRMEQMQKELQEAKDAAKRAERFQLVNDKESERIAKEKEEKKK